MGGSQWPKHLLTYISKHKQNFVTTKFKGEIFNIKYAMEKNQPYQKLQNMVDEIEKMTVRNEDDETPKQDLLTES